jgi:hypothetical protein
VAWRLRGDSNHQVRQCSTLLTQACVVYMQNSVNADRVERSVTADGFEANARDAKAAAEISDISKMSHL